MPKLWLLVDGYSLIFSKGVHQEAPGSGLVFNGFLKPRRTLRCECRPPVNREGEKD
jgi:hypothetical protein